VPDPRTLADALTLSRAAAALALAGLGLDGGSESLRPAAGLLLYSWTSDFFDGPLARASARPHSTWIGRQDLAVDVAVSGGLLVWLCGHGPVPVWLGILYAALFLVHALRRGLHRAIGMLVQGPVYATFIGVALVRDPAAGGLLVGWIVGVIVATWPRFPQEVVPEFLAGMRAAFGRREGP